MLKTTCYSLPKWVALNVLMLLFQLRRPPQIAHKLSSSYLGIELSKVDLSIRLPFRSASGNMIWYREQAAVTSIRSQYLLGGVKKLKYTRFLEKDWKQL